MQKVQLICVGYAGSIAANFNLLAPYLGDDVVFSVVEYRGRGNRSKECQYKDNDEMAEDVAKQIGAIRKQDLPYALLGYSMGAQVVYEVFAQGLLQDFPICTFLAAHEPPDVDCFGKGINLENDTAFLEHIKVYGGMDERLLQDSRFASIFIARMREDFRLLKSYRFSGIYHYIPSKVVVMYCETDTPYEVMKGWQRFSAGTIMFRQMGHSHFFFRTDTEEFCRVIEEKMKDILESGSAAAIRFSK